jgi:hypothetical protein
MSQTNVHVLQQAFLHGCTSAMSVCAAISSTVRELLYITKLLDPSGMIKSLVR